MQTRYRILFDLFSWMVKKPADISYDQLISFRNSHEQLKRLCGDQSPRNSYEQSKRPCGDQSPEIAVLEFVYNTMADKKVSYALMNLVYRISPSRNRGVNNQEPVHAIHSTLMRDTIVSALELCKSYQSDQFLQSIDDVIRQVTNSNHHSGSKGRQLIDFLGFLRITVRDTEYKSHITKLLQYLIRQGAWNNIYEACVDSINAYDGNLYFQDNTYSCISGFIERLAVEVVTHENSLSDVFDTKTGGLLKHIKYYFISPDGVRCLQTILWLSMGLPEWCQQRSDHLAWLNHQGDALCEEHIKVLMSEAKMKDFIKQWAQEQCNQLYDYQAALDDKSESSIKCLASTDEIKRILMPELSAQDPRKAIRVAVRAQMKQILPNSLTDDIHKEKREHLQEAIEQHLSKKIRSAIERNQQFDRLTEIMTQLSCQYGKIESVVNVLKVDPDIADERSDEWFSQYSKNLMDGPSPNVIERAAAYSSILPEHLHLALLGIDRDISKVFNMLAELPDDGLMDSTELQRFMADFFQSAKKHEMSSINALLTTEESDHEVCLHYTAFAGGLTEQEEEHCGIVPTFTDCYKVENRPAHGIMNIADNLIISPQAFIKMNCKNWYNPPQYNDTSNSSEHKNPFYFGQKGRIARAVKIAYELYVHKDDSIQDNQTVLYQLFQQYLHYNTDADLKSVASMIRTFLNWIDIRSPISEAVYKTMLKIAMQQMPNIKQYSSDDLMDAVRDGNSFLTKEYPDQIYELLNTTDVISSRFSSGYCRGSCRVISFYMSHSQHKGLNMSSFIDEVYKKFISIYPYNIELFFKQNARLADFWSMTLNYEYYLVNELEGLEELIISFVELIHNSWSDVGRDNTSSMRIEPESDKHYAMRMAVMQTLFRYKYFRLLQLLEDKPELFTSVYNYHKSQQYKSYEGIRVSEYRPKYSWTHDIVNHLDDATIIRNLAARVPDVERQTRYDKVESESSGLKAKYFWTYVATNHVIKPLVERAYAWALFDKLHNDLVCHPGGANEVATERSSLSDLVMMTRFIDCLDSAVSKQKYAGILLSYFLVLRTEVYVQYFLEKTNLNIQQLSAHDGMSKVLLHLSFGRHWAFKTFSALWLQYKYMSDTYDYIYTTAYDFLFTTPRSQWLPIIRDTILDKILDMDGIDGIDFPKYRNANGRVNPQLDLSTGFVGVDLQCRLNKVILDNERRLKPDLQDKSDMYVALVQGIYPIAVHLMRHSAAANHAECSELFSHMASREKTGFMTIQPSAHMLHIAAYARRYPNDFMARVHQGFRLSLSDILSLTYENVYMCMTCIRLLFEYVYQLILEHRKWTLAYSIIQFALNDIYPFDYYYGILGALNRNILAWIHDYEDKITSQIKSWDCLTFQDMPSIRDGDHIRLAWLMICWVINGLGIGLWKLSLKILSGLHYLICMVVDSVHFYCLCIGYIYLNSLVCVSIIASLLIVGTSLIAELLLPLMAALVLGDVFTAIWNASALLLALYPGAIGAVILTGIGYDVLAANASPVLLYLYAVAQSWVSSVWQDYSNILVSQWNGLVKPLGLADFQILHKSSGKTDDNYHHPEASRDENVTVYPVL